VVLAAVLAVLVIGGVWSQRPPLPVLATWSDRVTSPLAYSQDGRTLALSTDGSGIVLYDRETRQTRVLKQPERAALSTTFTPRGDKLVASAWTQGDERSVVVVGLETGDVQARITLGGSRTLLLALSPDGSRLFALAREAPPTRKSLPTEVQVWDTSTWEQLDTWALPDEVQNERVEGLLGPGLGLISISRVDPCPVLVRETPGFEAREFRVPSVSPKSGIYSAWSSPDGRWVTAGSTDGPGWIWNVASGEVVAQLPQRRGFATTTVMVSADRRFAAAIGMRIGQVPIVEELRYWLRPTKAGVPRNFLQVTVWDLEQGTKVATLPDQTFPVFAPDGSCLVTTGVDGRVTLWELPARVSPSAAP
jgi:WD40 repeat protein